MEGVKAVSPTEPPSNEEPKVEDEYASLSKLLLDFVNISNIDKGWAFPSGTGKDSKAIFSLSQPNLLANKKRNFLLSAIIPKTGSSEVVFQWSPFPVELSGVSIMFPSPSGSKVLIVRNPENDSPTKIEIWTPSDLEKKFEGVSWISDETLVAYVAEEPSPSKPTFNSSGYNSGGTADKDCNNWKGQGDWVEGWGETYANKRRPNLFIINVHRSNELDDSYLVNLTEATSSAFFPRFRYDNNLWISLPFLIS
ncbi:Acylamino-acid-releasing enzyme 1-like protein [Drosera capensis]